MRIINELLEEIRQKENIDEEEFEINLFMVIELTSSICYSSIILQEPYDIDTMKPYLFNMIKKITG